MRVASLSFSAITRLGVPCLLLAGLSACSSGGSSVSTASLAYGGETQRIQQEMRQDLQFERPAPQVKATVAAKTDKATSKKSASSAPVLDALEARDFINSYRIARGLRPLNIHPKLTQAAEMQAKDLAQRDEISHYGRDGSNPWMRLERTGYRPKVSAENVGTGQMTLREILKAWKDSPSHNANLLLADASDMGIALVYKPNSKHRAFWTLVVGAPLEDGAPVASVQGFQ